MTERELHQFIKMAQLYGDSDAMAMGYLALIGDEKALAYCVKYVQEMRDVS